MPVIDRIYGILFVINSGREHPPPHVHVKYNEYDASIDLNTGDVLAGELPQRALKIAKKWVKKNGGKALREWERMEKGETPQRIKTS